MCDEDGGARFFGESDCGEGFAHHNLSFFLALRFVRKLDLTMHSYNCDALFPTFFQDFGYLKAVVIIERTRDFVKLKADLTQFQTDDVATLRTKYDIKGVPTIIFLRGDGTEMANLRLVGFEDAESFVERVEQALRQ